MKTVVETVAQLKIGSKGTGERILGIILQKYLYCRTKNIFYFFYFPKVAQLGGVEKQDITDALARSVCGLWAKQQNY